MHSKEMLEKRISYEKMLAEISEMAVRVNDMDAFLQQALQRMGVTLHVSRVFMFGYQHEDRTFACRCGWDDPELGVRRGSGGIVLHIPDAAGELTSGTVLNYPIRRPCPSKTTGTICSPQG